MEPHPTKPDGHQGQVLTDVFIGIIHVCFFFLFLFCFVFFSFSCINICLVPRKLFEHEAARPSFQTSSEGAGMG